MSTHKVRIAIGHVLAILTLLCCFAFWVGLTLNFFSLKVALWPYFPAFLFLMSRIMALAVMFAVAGTILRTKLWRLALLISVATFFVSWWAMLNVASFVWRS